MATTDYTGGGGSSAFGNVQAATNPIFGMFGGTSSGGGGNPFGNMGGSQPQQNINYSNITSGAPGNPLFGNTPITGGYQNQPMSGAGSPFGVAPQPMSGSDNSLTAFFRGLSNLLGTTAPSFIQAGQNLMSMGVPWTQRGAGMQGAGFGTAAQAPGVMAPGIAYNQAILNNDPNALSSQAGPYASSIAAQNANVINQIQRGVPLGGGQLVSNMVPQMGANEIATAIQGYRPTAAQNLIQAGPQVAGVGASLAGIGQGLSQTGLGEQQTGLQTAGLGYSALQNAVQDMLQKMGINIQGGTSATFDQWAQGIGALLGGAGAAGKGIGQGIGAARGTTT
jgi:hypothetical protein